MSIPINNHKLEARIDRAFKILPYQQNKSQFLEDAVEKYIEFLYNSKLIKQKI